MSGVESDHLSDASSVFEEEPEVEWIQLREHPDFDIQSEYPFLIRKRANGRIILITRMPDQYLQVRLGNSKFLHHRVIAEQFLANLDNLPEIDHINHKRDDNHLDNM
jgi:hypothetical protein